MADEEYVWESAIETMVENYQMAEVSEPLLNDKKADDITVKMDGKTIVRFDEPYPFFKLAVVSRALHEMERPK